MRKTPEFSPFTDARPEARGVTPHRPSGERPQSPQLDQNHVAQAVAAAAVTRAPEAVHKTNIHGKDCPRPEPATPPCRAHVQVASGGHRGSAHRPGDLGARNRPHRFRTPHEQFRPTATRPYAANGSPPSTLHDEPGFGLLADPATTTCADGTRSETGWDYHLLLITVAAELGDVPGTGGELCMCPRCWWSGSGRANGCRYR